MKKYLLLLLLTACNKTDVPPPPCEDKFTLMINFTLTDQENIAYIEVEAGTESSPDGYGTTLNGEPGYEHTYTFPLALGDKNSLESKMIIWRFKIFAMDGSYFYTKYDTMVKQ